MRIPYFNISHVVYVMLLLSACLASSAQLPSPRCNMDVTRNVPYKQIDTITLQLDLYRPTDQPTPPHVVLAIHGGSWLTGSRDQIRTVSEFLTGQGFAVAVMEYRQPPQSPYPAALDDAHDALRWLQANAETYHLAKTPPAVLGISAGGHIVAMLGVESNPHVPPIAGVIAIAGPMDLTVPPPTLKAKIALQLYLDARREEHPEIYKESSPILRVTPDDSPFLLLHGEQDAMVPLAQSRRMADALRLSHVPVTLMTVHDMEHALPSPESPDGRDAWLAIINFLNSIQPEKEGNIR